MTTKKRNTQQDKQFTWMSRWCAKNGLALQLEGECGFGRECVGVTSDGSFPDYEWYGDNYERIDPNGEVWLPEDAYHKHPCVAVLGRGQKAEQQLYQWLRWFDDNGFVVESGPARGLAKMGIAALLMGSQMHHRMVKVPQ